MTHKYVANFDGGFRQGYMTYGYVCRTIDGKLIGKNGGYTKEYINTTNRAEYIALIQLLEFLISNGINNILIRGDSEIIINHVIGKTNIKSKHLKEKYEIVKTLLTKIDSVIFKWIPREENNEADSETKVDLPQQKRRKKRDGQI